MRVERREQVTCIGIVRVNGKPEELDGPDGRQQPSMGGTSRMSREAQVRICERLGVKFPGPTRPRGEIPRAYSPCRAGALSGTHAYEAGSKRRSGSGWGWRSTGTRRAWWICGKRKRVWTFWATRFAGIATSTAAILNT